MQTTIDHPAGRIHDLGGFRQDFRKVLIAGTICPAHRGLGDFSQFVQQVRGFVEAEFFADVAAGTGDVGNGLARQSAYLRHRFALQGQRTYLQFGRRDGGIFIEQNRQGVLFHPQHLPRLVDEHIFRPLSKHLQNVGGFFRITGVVLQFRDELAKFAAVELQKMLYVGNLFVVFFVVLFEFCQSAVHHLSHQRSKNQGGTEKHQERYQVFVRRHPSEHSERSGGDNGQNDGHIANGGHNGQYHQCKAQRHVAHGKLPGEGTIQHDAVDHFAHEFALRGDGEKQYRPFDENPARQQQCQKHGEHRPLYRVQRPVHRVAERVHHRQCHDNPDDGNGADKQKNGDRGAFERYPFEFNFSGDIWVKRSHHFCEDSQFITILAFFSINIFSQTDINGHRTLNPLYICVGKRKSQTKNHNDMITQLLIATAIAIPFAGNRKDPEQTFCTTVGTEVANGLFSTQFGIYGGGVNPLLSTYYGKYRRRCDILHRRFKAACGYIRGGFFMRIIN